MAKPGMVAVTAGLLALIWAGQVASGAEKPASALSYENPVPLTIAEILEKWQEASASLPESGTLSFRGTLSDHIFDTEQDVRWELSWDGPSRIQLVSAVSRNHTETNQTNSALPMKTISLWSIGPDFFVEADLMEDAFTAEPVPRELSPVVTDRGGRLQWWGSGWFPFPLEPAATLIGPGWICARDEWGEDWEWTIGRQDAGRVILDGVPRISANARYFQRVRWIVDRATWSVTAVRMTDPAGSRVTTLFREGSPWPSPLSRPLVTVDELKRRGFRLRSSDATNAEVEVLPADALLPRNDWGW